MPGKDIQKEAATLFSKGIAFRIVEATRDIENIVCDPFGNANDCCFARGPFSRVCCGGTGHGLIL